VTIIKLREVNFEAELDTVALTHLHILKLRMLCVGVLEEFNLVYLIWYKSKCFNSVDTTLISNLRVMFAYQLPLFIIMIPSGQMELNEVLGLLKLD
jgi:hypothetical protein